MKIQEKNLKLFDFCLLYLIVIVNGFIMRLSEHVNIVKVICILHYNEWRL